jgi:hypothetical protein
MLERGRIVVIARIPLQITGHLPKDGVHGTEWFPLQQTVTFGTAARGGASAMAFEGGLGSAVNFPRSRSFSKESFA